MKSISGKRVLVIGLGVSGKSAAFFLLKRGASVVGADKHAAQMIHDSKMAELFTWGLKCVSDQEILNINEFDLVVVSPGIVPTHPLYQKAKAARLPLIGEVELACRYIDKKALGITGTNGKTTVTLLIAHALNAAGMKAKALGNVGTPLTSALDDPECKDTEVFVVELSSFQLDTLHTKFLDSAAILNITPDHLDRYTTMESYALSKIQIHNNLKGSGKLFVEEKCLKNFAPLFNPVKSLSYGYSQDCYIYTDTKHVYLEGEKAFTLPEEYIGKRNHELENMISSFALCHTMGLSGEQFLRGFTTFKKPAHRIELIRTLQGVHYYDDSKGTNIDAVIRAVEYLQGQIVLIAGGVDKGFPYTSWIDVFANRVKFICAIGQAAAKIQADVGSYIPVKIFKTLNDATLHASSIACKGDNILLSPGCSSYDMFKDYEHRGNEFQRIVNALK